MCLFQDFRSSQELAVSQNSTSEDTSSSQELSQDFSSFAGNSQELKTRSKQRSVSLGCFSLQSGSQNPRKETALRIVDSDSNQKNNPIASCSKSVVPGSLPHSQSKPPDRISKSSSSGVSTLNISNSSNDTDKSINQTGGNSSSK